MAKEMGGKDYLVCDQCRVKKIRCNREKPSCANCTRLSLKCEWSGQGKKCNQTALLGHIIIGLSSRLQNLESSVLDTRNSLKRPFEESSIVPTGPTTPPADQARPILEVPASQSPRLVTEAVYARPLGRFATNPKSGRSERYFGPTSLASLMLDINDIIAERFEAEPQRLSEHAQEAQSRINLLIAQGERALLNDGPPPTPPPFAILDAMIEPYFATNNQHFPIWQKEKFIEMATDLRRSAFPERDHASIVCCNNLILITLNANSLRSCRGRPTQSKYTCKRSSIDSDINAGFLANAKRAIEHIELLLSPCLLNLQALLSLCAVAQEYFSSEIFQSLFALASQCAKAIGVDQWQCCQDQLSDEDAKERRSLSYCLYILDKVICWTYGTFPGITISYIHIDSTIISPDDSAMTLLVARTRLAAIEETIYHEMYASQVKPKNEDQVRQMATELLLRLQDWLASSAVNLGDVESGSDSSPWKIELVVQFFCAQLLLIWPYRDHPNVIFRRRADVSRRCMRLLLRLWNSTSDEGLQAQFPRILASHPPLYLHEICVQILHGTDEESDTELIRNFTEVLQTVTDNREEGSFNDWLCEFSLIVMDVINTIKTQSSSKRRKIVSGSEHRTPMRSVRSPAPDHHSPFPTPNSDNYSFSHNLSSIITPLPLGLALESEQQYLEGFDFPNWEDSLGLITPTGSGPSEPEQQQADDSENITNSFGRGLLENLNFLNSTLQLASDGAHREV